MLDIQFIRDNADLIRYSAERRGLQLDLNQLVTADDERKRLSLSLQGKKARVRVLAPLVEQGDASALASHADLQREIAQEETSYADALLAFKREMVRIPNLPDISVPTGDDTHKRVEIARSELPLPSETTLDAMMKGAGVSVVARGENNWHSFERTQTHAYTALERYVRRSFESAGFALSRILPGTTKEASVAAGALPDEVATFLSDVSFGLVGHASTPYLLSQCVGAQYTVDALPDSYASEILLFRPHRARTLGTVYGTLTIVPPRHDLSVEHHERVKHFFEKLLGDLTIPYKTSVVTARASHPSVVKSYEISLPWVKDDYTLVRVDYFHDFQTRRAGIKCTDTDAKVRFAHTVTADGLCIEELFAIVHAVHGENTQSFLDSLVS